MKNTNLATVEVEGEVKKMEIELPTLSKTSNPPKTTPILRQVWKKRFGDEKPPNRSLNSKEMKRFTYTNVFEPPNT